MQINCFLVRKPIDISPHFYMILTSELNQIDLSFLYRCQHSGNIFISFQVIPDINVSEILRKEDRQTEKYNANIEVEKIAKIINFLIKKMVDLH